MNRALTLKWFAVLGLASLFYLLAPRDVSPQMPLYLGMTSAAVIIWTFDLLPAVAVAAALTFLYLLTNMAPPEVVLGPWTTVLIWTTFGAAIFGEAMEKTGLAKRVALRCMLLTGGTFTGMLIGFAIGGIILGLLLASGVIGFFQLVHPCNIGIIAEFIRRVCDTVQLTAHPRTKLTYNYFNSFVHILPAVDVRFPIVNLYIPQSVLLPSLNPRWTCQKY